MSKVQGTVKWFSNRKGFGFVHPITPNSPTSEDIFVHHSAIQSEGEYRTLVSANHEWNRDCCDLQRFAVHLVHDFSVVIPCSVALLMGRCCHCQPLAGGAEYLMFFLFLSFCTSIAAVICRGMMISIDREFGS
jgi:cold shock CspA family protein